MNPNDFDMNISDVRFVAWDTETTGISADAENLVEIAALAFDEEFEHRKFQSLIKPPKSIPFFVTKIHGITDQTVALSPRVGEVLQMFGEFLSNVGSPRVLVAHNAGFDVGFVHAETKRQTERARSPFNEIVLDSCALAKTLLPDLERHGLEALAVHFKIERGRLHRAEEDVRVLKEVFMRLLGIAADRAAGPEGLTLGRLIELANGHFVMSGQDREIWAQPRRLPNRIEELKSLLGTSSRVAIQYETENDYRYITPVAIKTKGFRLYIEAFCHRDNIKKTFRGDKILKIGRVERPDEADGQVRLPLTSSDKAEL